VSARLEKTGRVLRDRRSGARGIADRHTREQWHRACSVGDALPATSGAGVARSGICRAGGAPASGSAEMQRGDTPLAGRGCGRRRTGRCGGCVGGGGEGGGEGEGGGGGVVGVVGVGGIVGGGGSGGEGGGEGGGGGRNPLRQRVNFAPVVCGAGEEIIKMTINTTSPYNTQTGRHDSSFWCDTCDRCDIEIECIECESRISMPSGHKPIKKEQGENK
jgi:hypothetical protein